MSEHKIVHDSVHGGIRLEGVHLSLLETPELQRLHGIHQLGLAYLVYPEWLSGGPWQVGWDIRALEYGPCLGLVVWQVWQRRRASQGAS